MPLLILCYFPCIFHSVYSLEKMFGLGISEASVNMICHFSETKFIPSLGKILTKGCMNKTIQKWGCSFLHFRWINNKNKKHIQKTKQKNPKQSKKKKKMKPNQHRKKLLQLLVLTSVFWIGPYYRMSKCYPHRNVFVQTHGCVNRIVGMGSTGSHRLQAALGCCCH